MSNAIKTTIVIKMMLIVFKSFLDMTGLWRGTNLYFMSAFLGAKRKHIIV